MKITTVSYTKTFNLGNYSSEKISVEVEIIYGDNVEHGLDEAKKLVEDFHRKNNPQLYEQIVQVTQEPTLVNHTREKPKTTEEKVLEGINTSKELTVLKSYELLSNKYPKLKEAYQAKLKELTSTN